MQKLVYLKEDGARIESETISKSHFGGLDAAHLLVTYKCPGSGDRHILSSIKALSPDKRFFYTLEIYSPADRYESDRVVLDQLVRSWKKIPGSQRLKRK